MNSLTLIARQYHTVFVRTLSPEREMQTLIRVLRHAHTHQDPIIVSEVYNNPTMKHTAHTSKGFTLIEILVAATIIAVLSVVGVASYTRINMRSRDAKRKSDLEQVRSALEMYRVDNTFYPGSSTGFNPLSTDLEVLVSADPPYMPSMPTDPKPQSNDYYYSPLVPMGTPTRYYGYCICAKLENNSGSGTCTGVTLPSDGCNYGLKNP